ncbi:hypothetical protein ACJX0J_017711, partial [Zea mays]
VLFNNYSAIPGAMWLELSFCPGNVSFLLVMHAHYSHEKLVKLGDISWIDLIRVIVGGFNVSTHSDNAILAARGLIILLLAVYTMPFDNMYTTIVNDPNSWHTVLKITSIRTCCLLYLPYFQINLYNLDKLEWQAYINLRIVACVCIDAISCIHEKLL